MNPTKTLRTATVRPLLLAAALLAAAAGPLAAQTCPDPEAVAWPLCGNYYLTADDDWDPTQGCPCERRGDAAFADDVQDPIGPRLSNDEYDWHRGIDLPTRFESQVDANARRPTFAILGGRVIEAIGGPDGRVMIEHPRAGNNPPDSCFPNGCFYSRYAHLWEVAVGEQQGVVTGAYLGLTGRPANSTYDHLHFEIRSSILPVAHDSQRETVHPFTVLPYADSATGPCADAPGETCDPTIEVSFATRSELGGSAIDDDDPAHPVVTVLAELPADTEELDLGRIELELYDNQGWALVPMPQGSFQTSPQTPEDEDWELDPSALDFHKWNRQYTYKNSAGVLYAEFFAGQAYESPFAATLPAIWNRLTTPDHHLTATTPLDDDVGEFNGARVYAPPFTASLGSRYGIYVQFRALESTADAGDLCLRAKAYDIRGNRSAAVAEWGSCDAPPPPPELLDVESLQCWGHHQLAWAPVTGATHYRVLRTDDFPFVSWKTLVYEGPRTEIVVEDLGGDWASFAVRACSAAGCSALTVGDEDAFFHFGCSSGS